MRVVGIDTATPDTAVAALADETVVFRSVHGPGEDGRPRHAALALAGLEAAADSIGGWEAVDRLAVGIGPGSFTGMRVGITTVRAIAQALKLDVVPVGTLDVLAAGVPESGPSLRVLAIDARRGQVFATALGEHGEIALAPGALAPEEVVPAIGMVDGRGVIAGDGAVRYRDTFVAAGLVVPPDEDPVHRLDPARLCRLAAASEPSSHEEVQPLYIRRPDAALWRERQAAGRRG